MRGAVRIRTPRALVAAIDLLLPERLNLDVHGTRISAAATSPDALRRLALVYGAFKATRQGPPDARLALVEAGHPAHARLARLLRPDDPSGLTRGHLLIADWHSFALSLRGDTLLHYYASKLLRLHLVARQEPDVLTLHAASIAGRERRGFLLVGEAASGKTTLTLQLIARGLAFGSDDTTVIRRGDRKCLPFPLAFVLRGAPDGSAPDMDGVRGRTPDLQLLDEPRWLLPRPEAAAEAPFRVDTIFFLNARADLTPGEPVPLSPGEAAMELLRNTVVPLGRLDTPQQQMIADFHLVCDLANEARCLSLNSTQPSRTLATVLALTAPVPA